MADNPETHSRRVARLRKILPALALVACLALVFGAAPDIGQILGQRGDSEVRNALRGLAISDPIFEGNLSDDGRTYRMTAKSGVQTSGERIQLEAISLTVSPAAKAPGSSLILGADKGFTLDADKGELDVAQQVVQFQGSVKMSDSYGSRLTTQTLNTDLAKGLLHAPQSITLQAPSGTLQAEALRADTKTLVYVFDKARFHIAPQEGNVQ